MKTRTSPTSPAAQKKDNQVAAIWQPGQIQQPVKTPWGRVTVLAFILGVLTTTGVLAGAGWYIHRNPNSWLARYAMVNSTTTVIQPARETIGSTVPENVQRLLDVAYGIHPNLGEAGVYRPTEASGYAWALSSSGWLVTLSGAWPIDVTSLVSVPAVGSARAITSNLHDSASPFVFLKTTDVSTQPVTFAPRESQAVGGQVWVVTNQGAFPRQLGAVVEPRWSASDRRESYMTLDASMSAPVGSAVVDAQGRMVGLLGTDSQVWLIETIEPIVRDVVQSAAISRPGIGIRTLNLATATVVGEQPTLGLLIGAGEGQTAVTPKSPADKAGLKSGDVIESIDTTANLDDLFSVINKHKSGDQLKIIYRRDGQEKTTTITVGSVST